MIICTHTATHNCNVNNLRRKKVSSSLQSGDADRASAANLIQLMICYLDIIFVLAAILYLILYSQITNILIFINIRYSNCNLVYSFWFGNYMYC